MILNVKKINWDNGGIMKKSNKLISTVVVSTVLASSCIAVMANNCDGYSQDSQS